MVGTIAQKRTAAITTNAGGGGQNEPRIAAVRPSSDRQSPPPMPKYQAEDSHAKTVERFLHARDLPHLRARKYGATVIVESGPKDDAYKHLRFTRDGVHVWQLHIVSHRGRWEYTPF